MATTISLPELEELIKKIDWPNPPDQPRSRHSTVRSLLATLAIAILAITFADLRTAATPVEQGTALAALETLPVKARVSGTGYARDKFGPAWMDVDKNGCDTRNDILARDLTGVKYTTRTETCRVNAGTLADPYTGKNIRFKRGAQTSAAVQIDHVVPLMDAWRKGAKSWNLTKREQFANDPLNLMAADGLANQAKGAKDASGWLPSNTAFHCQYVARQVAVKAKYGLWLTKTEAVAMHDVLNTCPNEPLPAG